jgi:hypothetical protein
MDTATQCNSPLVEDIKKSSEITSVLERPAYVIKEGDELTPMVVEYKLKPNANLFKKIYYSKTIKRLLWQVIKNYGVMNFPPIIQEDIAEDCQSEVLLRSIGKYDQAKGGSFVTLFTWWCMSHVRNKRNQWLRREPLLNAYSIDDEVKVSKKYSKFNENTKHRISRNIAEDNLEGVFEEVKEEENFPVIRETKYPREGVFNFIVKLMKEKPHTIEELMDLSGAAFDTIKQNIMYTSKRKGVSIVLVYGARGEERYQVKEKETFSEN